MNEKVVIEMTFDEYEEYKKQKKIDEYSFLELIDKAVLKNGVKQEYGNASDDPLGYRPLRLFSYEDEDVAVSISIIKR